MSTVGSARTREAALGFAMLLPSLLVFALFIFYPLAKTAWLGLHTTDFFGSNQVWVGWSQYKDALTSPEFRHSLGVTLRFVVLVVPAGLVLGVGLAVLAHKPLNGIRAFRTVFSSTVATSVAVAAVMWLVLLQPAIGFLSNVLGGTFPVLKSPGLLNDPSTALFAVSLTTIWQNLGFTFIVVTAGLQSIPEELYESALIDGAGGWSRFVNVTLPMLSPTILFAGTVLLVNSLQSYGQIDMLTSGGPGGRTSVVVYYLYGRTSPINGNQGFQAATAMWLFVIILGLSLLQFRTLEKRVHYGS